MSETARRGDAAGDARRRVLDAVFDLAPRAAAIVAFTAGVLALIAAATPSAPHIPGLDALERFAEELPEFTASVAGVGLIVLAIGVQRRLDAAWSASCALLAFLSIFAFVRREHAAAGIVCAVILGLLVLARRAFYRRSGLSALLRSHAWHLPVAAGLAIAIVAGLLWASSHAAFVDSPWWALFTDPHLGRPGRALSVAVAVGAAILAWGFAARARLPPEIGGADEVARARLILKRAQSARPDAQLALLGDKTFLFTENDTAFVMCAPSGGSLIAMGGPVGARAAWRSALQLLRDEGERRALRPVVYAAPPDLLPDLLDLGFHVQKVGENAVVELHGFSLDGPHRQPLRNARRRLAERCGATFEVRNPPYTPVLMQELEEVSRAWLDMHKGAEKGFSLGRFDPAYLADQPLALVRVRGAIVAFANIWTTPDKVWAAIDLMRHHPETAPPRTMDFLFAELFLWAAREGFAKFDLGMAPLSGMGEERYAPLFARLGRAIYERAGALYNFQGLRAFKEKFNPNWEPRYLAAPGAFSLPIVLAETAMLTARVLDRPKHGALESSFLMRGLSHSGRAKRDPEPGAAGHRICPWIPGSLLLPAFAGMT
jgi:lysylphosphatidylglycerol synthetase-like protein (DUF2156 family)